MEPLRLLVTAAGAPGTAALLRALRGNGERPVYLVGCDMNELAVGRFLCDTFAQVPPGADQGFAAAIADLCEREAVDLVLPQSSHDLGGLAAARNDIPATVLVSSPETVRTANDKAECYARLAELGVRVPEFRRVRRRDGFATAAEELGYPERAVCFKPAYSSGSRGFRVLDPKVDRAQQLLRDRPGSLALRLEEVLEVLPEEGEELLVMELAQGGERTIDGIGDGERVLFGHPKTREAMRAGLAMYFRTLADPGLMEIANKIVGALALEYFFNIQLVGDVVIEVNPRISTVVYQGDLNLPWLGIRHALGEISAAELAGFASRVRRTRRALRYFDQIEWDD
jgi:carbamoyl-phosphate synthase large subunit